MRSIIYMTVYEYKNPAKISWCFLLLPRAITLQMYGMTVMPSIWSTPPKKCPSMQPTLFPFGNTDHQKPSKIPAFPVKYSKEHT
jgi:hypothetical protein